MYFIENIKKHQQSNITVSIGITNVLESIIEIKSWEGAEMEGGPIKNLAVTKFDARSCAWLGLDKKTIH